MQVQHQVKSLVSSPEIVAYVEQALADDSVSHRTELAERICDRFEIVDARGVAQRSSCLRALRELEQEGYWQLPAAQTYSKSPQPRRLSRAVSAPVDVPTTLSDMAELNLVLVEDEESRRVWNELMIQEHPRGAGPLVGRQLRYLLDSPYGYLAALGFAAAALQLEDRDRWIGWDASTRRDHLHRVVGLSRFLVRPQVRCQNLASYVLGSCLRRVADDLEKRYGIRPLLVETFVDTTEFSGGCFRAANWERIGRTKGRGRQDRDHTSSETVKDIYAYPLAKDFRIQIGLPSNAGMGALGLADGLCAEHWAEQEFGSADLGDKRLGKRLIQSARALAEKPGKAFTAAAQGDHAAVKGYYRFIEKPDESAVTPEAILQPHRQQTIRRIRDQNTVLCIQDGTALDFTNLSQCSGLGATGRNQTGASSRGLNLHSTLAVSGEGLPLGILRAQFSAPELSDRDPSKNGPRVPIEEKKTFCWIEGLRDCAEVAREAKGTRLISVMDREADFFELFSEHRATKGVELLVRAQYNRRTSQDLKLFDGIRQEEERGRRRIHVQRQSARPKKSKQKAQGARKDRMADVSLRYQRVELQAPDHLPEQAPIELWMVHLREDDPPAGAQRLEWFLLTSVEIHDEEAANRCLDWYCLRWRIEDWHRVIKSGCGIEELGHQTAERLKRAIAMRLVVGWRIMLMTLLGRETPELPADVLFTDIEIEVLQAYAEQSRLKLPRDLGSTVRLVARLGGYLGRRGDPPPGHQVMWEGYSQLHFMCLGFELRGP